MEGGEGTGQQLAAGQSSTGCGVHGIVLLHLKAGLGTREGGKAVGTAGGHKGKRGMSLVEWGLEGSSLLRTDERL